MGRKSQQGAITLEACVTVLLFLILMLFLSSLFVMFMAQNMTAHAVLQTSQSLSMDAYSIEKLIKADDGSAYTVSDTVSEFVTRLFGSSENNPYFVTDTYWYDADSTQIEQAIKMRFIGYLLGGEKTEADDIDDILENMNIVDGLSGLDFSGSYVANDTLYIVLRYELEYDFNIWNVGTVEVEQRTCSKLWK